MQAHVTAKHRRTDMQTRDANASQQSSNTKGNTRPCKRTDKAEHADAKLPVEQQHGRDVQTPPTVKCAARKKKKKNKRTRHKHQNMQTDREHQSTPAMVPAT